MTGCVRDGFMAVFMTMIIEIPEIGLRMPHGHRIGDEL